MKVRRAITKDRRAKRGQVEALLEAEVRFLMELGPGKAVRIDPATANPHSIAGKVVELRQAGKELYSKIRVTIMDGAAFIYMSQTDQPSDQNPK